MLGVRVMANTDPHADVADFNAALTAARRRSTLDDEDVKGLFIKALDPNYYTQRWSHPVFYRQHHDDFRLLVRARILATRRGDTATTDLAEKLLDLKRQLKALTDVMVHKRGCTPRAVITRYPKGSRIAAPALKRDGIWSQTVSEKMTFYKGTGQTNSFRENKECMRDRRRDTGTATARVAAIDNDGSEKFDALCLLVGSEPKLLSDFSACSFCECDGDPLAHAVNECTQFLQPHDADMAAFRVGGAVHDGIVFNTFGACTDAPPPAASPPPPAVPESESSEDGGSTGMRARLTRCCRRRLIARLRTSPTDAPDSRSRRRTPRRSYPSGICAVPQREADTASVADDGDSDVSDTETKLSL
ncbi:hypothetical protein CYMTET_14722 [Cymbomonas tetramitiformis]|uniref:Uncharacterized protein n=1 Tax=Cymbomonas tetramitiformis TaxID=36881 RepID=A0AAE0GFI8_9CHLO|nr:hypothetical protein CYMTET_14722 [Cymbomonas tetramitiformis]